jgi:hypothetical protein
MARLTFKEYLNEDELLTRPLRMVKLKKDPTDPTGKRLIKDVEAEKEDIGNYPDNVDQLTPVANKVEPTRFDQSELAKPVISGGFGKTRTTEMAKRKVTNSDFGPSQFYKIDASLKTPDKTFREER